ncbi:MAG: hypothetical protein IH591_01965 [Bacteroidales bacterium]|nr:hypothetical protein [Bacteroidales bacterium]
MASDKNLITENRVLKELAIWIFNKIGDIQKGSFDLSPAIFDVLSYGRNIPKGAWYLIPDIRYHEQFDILFGFKWYMGRLAEPPYDIIHYFLESIAREMKPTIVRIRDMHDLILHTLIVKFFEEHPEYLKS